MPGARDGKGDGPRKPGLEKIAAKVALFARQLAAYRGLQKADRDDLGQEVAFKYIWRHSSDPEFLDFEGFAKRKTRADVEHRVIDRKRSDGSREVREEEWEAERFEESIRDIHEAQEDDAAAVFRERELFEVAGFELNEMSKKARDVWLMHKVDGVSIEETAVKMGMKEDAVKKSILRSGQRLREALVDFRRPKP